MPIHKRAVQKTTRVSGSASRIRMLEYEAKGVTSEFDDLLQMELEQKADLDSKQLPDPYTYQTMSTLPIGLEPLYPTFSFEQLAKIVQGSNILRQCIESYVVNIESYGHTLEYIGPEGKEDKPQVQAEKAMLEAFLSNCSPELTLREVRERSRWDLETFAVRFFEVSRDRAGRIVLLDHVPGLTMLRTRRDVDPVEVTIEVPNPADPAQIVRKTATRHFCRFVQRSYGSGGWKSVYFKEFGDPRSINPDNGQIDNSLAIEKQATEILMSGLYTPGQIYGLPRWWGQLPSILGSREAEIVNLNFFKENAIPALAVLISGGALTKDSFNAVEQYLTAIRGKRAMNRILVLEAQADDITGAVDKGGNTTRIDMKPMGADRQQDGLFGAYDKDNQAKARSAFRLPPIYTGRAEDYTRASAFASMVTAEQQIFQPERTGFDDLMNNKILRTYRPKYWRYKSGGIPIVDPEVLGNMILALDETGALTPNAVIKIANRVLGVEIKPVTEDWGDFPFQATLQYINQGKDIPGLTEYLVDIEAEMAKDQLKFEQQQELIASKPTAFGSGAKPGGKPTSNDKKIKPVNNNDSKSKQRKVMRELQDTVRKEMQTIVAELKSSIVEAVQVTAQDDAA